MSTRHFLLIEKSILCVRSLVAVFQWMFVVISIDFCPFSIWKRHRRGTHVSVRSFYQLSTNERLVSYQSAWPPSWSSSCWVPWNWLTYSSSFFPRWAWAFDMEMLLFSSNALRNMLCVKSFQLFQNLENVMLEREWRRCTIDSYKVAKEILEKVAVGRCRS